MKKIEQIVDFIFDEVKDAEKYIEAAMHLKMDDKALADKYHQLAELRIKSAEDLHAQATRMMEDHKREHGEVSPKMMAYWEIRHEDIVEDITDVKRDVLIYRP